MCARVRTHGARHWAPQQDEAQGTDWLRGSVAWVIVTHQPATWLLPRCPGHPAQRLSAGSPQVTFHDVDALTEKLFPIVEAMQKHFSAGSGAYYSDSIFFLSVAMHRIMPEGECRSAETGAGWCWARRRDGGGSSCHGTGRGDGSRGFLGAQAVCSPGVTGTIGCSPARCMALLAALRATGVVLQDRAEVEGDATRPRSPSSGAGPCLLSPWGYRAGQDVVSPPRDQAFPLVTA